MCKFLFEKQTKKEIFVTVRNNNGKKMKEKEEERKRVDNSIKITSL